MFYERIILLVTIPLNPVSFVISVVIPWLCRQVWTWLAVAPTTHREMLNGGFSTIDLTEDLLSLYLAYRRSKKDDLLHKSQHIK